MIAFKKFSEERITREMRNASEPQAYDFGLLGITGSYFLCDENGKDIYEVPSWKVAETMKTLRCTTSKAAAIVAAEWLEKNKGVAK